jgi:hypothetical protein
MAKSECIGTSQWWKNVDILSHRRNRAHIILDNEFKENLNDYFGELCWGRDYEQPTLMEIDSITIKAPQFSITQVKNALLKIRKTATGPDEIPFWVWKENADVFAPVMTKIWNQSLSTSTWPTSWKIAHIDPLPKVENPKEYCEFRGINVTSVIGRCFERTVYHYHSKRSFEAELSSSQFAYRIGGCSTDALIKLQYMYLKALEEPNCDAVRLIAMDFSKAFDNVKHAKLSEKLKSSSMNPYLVNWYLNFLKDRRQRIVFQGTTCKWKDINKGVMQGTVTGPHFFNLFINDLEIKNCSNTPLVKFADDSSLLVPILKNTQDCSSKAIDEFKN